MSGIGRVNSLTTAQYTAQLVDESGSNIALSSLVSLTLTLYDFNTGTIINSRDHQNVLNAHNVTVSSTGALTFLMQAIDNAIVTPTVESELHTMLFEGVFSGSKQLAHEYSFRVVNIQKE